MSREPDLKTITLHNRHYRIDHEGQVLVWKTPIDSYELRWCKVQDEELAKKIKEMLK